MSTGKPNISVVVIIHNMQREAPRTLHSLSPAYQQGISAEDYEVLVYENGSDKPLSQDQIDSLPANFHYHYLEDASPSPVFALNQGLAEARGDLVGCMIDGARIVTPGLLARALEAAPGHQRPIVATLDWYLGPDLQRHALLNGYSTEAEDQLLEDINWPNEPYRLFEISVQDESSVDGWFSKISESNALFMHKAQWQELGGFDERFDAAGGGLINLDMFRRACHLPDAQLLMLTDEATFHQAHGGTATNTPPEVQQKNIQQWRYQYEQIRGEPFSSPTNSNRVLYGQIRAEMAPAFARSLVHPTSRKHAGSPEHCNLMGRIPFNTTFWCDQQYVAEQNRRLTDNSSLSIAIKFARDLFASHRWQEARDICRLLNATHPDDIEVTRLLRLCATADEIPEAAPPQRWAMYFAAIADVHALLGDPEEAERGWQRALELNPKLDSAREGLAKASMPGPDHYVMLNHLHNVLQPGLYLEVGVDQGRSIAAAQPPTHVVGIDPKPHINTPPRAECNLLPIASDDFFASNRASELLSSGIDLAFIDGLHEFQQIVRDFWHVERYCKEDATIVLHETIPYDDYSATQTPQTSWWAGDVWKLIPLLQSARPDLEMFVIRTPPSGLTVIRDLKSTPVTSLEDFEKQAREFAELDVAYLHNHVLPEIEQIANEPEAVTRRRRTADRIRE